MPSEPTLPPGLYETLVTERVTELLGQLPEALRPELTDLQAEEAPLLLSRHVAEVVHRTLRALGKTGGEEAEFPTARLAHPCIELLQALYQAVGEEYARLEEQVAAPPRVLHAVLPAHPSRPRRERPTVPLGQSALLVNERGDPSLSESLRRELDSADRVDLLCAFINWNGLRLLREPLAELIRRGGALRVLTSTYMGITERRAVDELSRLGAEVKVAYDREPARTRLHAKAWLLRRDSGFSTAYIGSSNISHSALTDGLEWNVRLSAVDAPSLLQRFDTTFERYWHDPTFEPYEPERDGPRLQRAVGRVDPLREAADPACFFDLHPFPHQREILEQLDRERQVFNRWRNLVVAATGTGKTLVAAFDYQRLRRQRGELTLLFIAHREEILRQARHQFRNVLRDGGFGELWVGGEHPTERRHVFASVQSLAAAGEGLFAPDHFEMVVLDEMHHAPAQSYDRLLQALQPRILLGLTATPERADGLDTLRHFDGTIAAELRLWDALELQLLAPFHYFGVPDDVDLSSLRWQRGAYMDADLEAIYIGASGRNRVAKILEALNRYVSDTRTIRALGFCVSIAHAEFMARCFNEAGLPALAVTGRSPADARSRAVQALRSGTVRVLFTVDLFNEGVDIPEVDTLLFLRPTESATLFLQQLGRGLRLCEGKSCVTVFDFIGLQHAKFRFDRRYRALTGMSRTQVEEAVEHGFQALPPGCDIRLERTAREVILRNLREAVQAGTTRRLVGELRSLGDLSLPAFLRETGLDLEDLYRGGRTLTTLRRHAGFVDSEEPEGERAAGRGLQRLLGQDDPDWFAFCQRGLLGADPPEPDSLPPRALRLWRMLLATVAETALGDDPDPTLALLRLWELDDLRRELAELLGVLRDATQEVTHALSPPEWAEVPLRVHGSYGRNSVATAFWLSRPSALREGVRWFPEYHTDVFFVTFRKTEGEFSPTTRYDDYVVAPDQLHWESQSTTTAESPTGRRYQGREGEKSRVLIFAREQKVRDGRTLPYFCLGPAEYVSHESERPMRIRWRLQHPLPERVYERFRAASG
jgi:superfamily II DNA or RNA helicase/HKD family nuclease